MRQFLQSLSKQGTIIAVKRGPLGAVCFAGGNIYTAGTEAIKPVDSIGAGDAFCAGFLSAWVRNMPVPECAALGNKTARIVLEVPGTRVHKQQFMGLV
jgi:2-dehydro-3-deoxygluconokinase